MSKNHTHECESCHGETTVEIEARDRHPAYPDVVRCPDCEGRGRIECEDDDCDGAAEAA